MCLLVYVGVHGKSLLWVFVFGGFLGVWLVLFLFFCLFSLVLFRGFLGLLGVCILVLVVSRVLGIVFVLVVFGVLLLLSRLWLVLVFLSLVPLLPLSSRVWFVVLVFLLSAQLPLVWVLVLHVASWFSFSPCTLCRLVLVYYAVSPSPLGSSRAYPFSPLLSRSVSA